MRIEWNDDLLTGIPVIDQQHKELFRRINRLLEACIQRNGTVEVLETLRFLQKYVVEHFTMEEQVMRKAAYAGYRHHEELHRGFRASIEELAAEIDRDGVGPQTVVRVNRMIVDWLNMHIRKVDRAMAIKLREQFATA